MATNSSRLNLTRDQLASFLIDHQQIKQFEMLFSAVDAIAPNVVLEINIAVGTAQATANNAIDQIIALGQDMAVNDAAMSAKVHQAMDAIPRLAQALELLAAAPVAQAQMPLFDDLTPRAELGTMAAQNAANVNITGGTIAGITFGGFPAGTVSLPSLYWTTDTATGFYRIGANNIGYSYNGTKLLDFSSALLAVTGVLSTTNKVTAAGPIETTGATGGAFAATKWFVQMETASLARSYVCGVDGATYGSWTHYSAYSTGTPAAIFTASTTGFDVQAGVLTTLGGATFHTTSTALGNGAGAAAGTLLNAPAAGNPTKWIGINDNGTTRYIPAW